ncbi:hypothetical protein K466DRAFT_183303 [Polyporus arcularius HHB13444]|uniref:Uncharacterized protein n=1 Tax=Polyporus arcularius HHB13444 TaxID=1314778 RepID=A0A5C3P8H2_9APHY|nr:hypothetical protein K466DRAFT_183303 [Polyporus arcularius HHB13444]
MYHIRLSLCNATGSACRLRTLTRSSCHPDVRIPAMVLDGRSHRLSDIGMVDMVQAGPGIGDVRLPHPIVLRVACHNLPSDILPGCKIEDRAHEHVPLASRGASDATSQRRVATSDSQPYPRCTGLVRLNSSSGSAVWTLWHGSRQ